MCVFDHVALRLHPLQVGGKTVSSIGPGLLCYIGIGARDTADDASYMCVKGFILIDCCVFAVDGPRDK